MGPCYCVLGTISFRGRLFYFWGGVTCPCCYKPDALFCCIGYQRMCSSTRCCVAFDIIKYFYSVNHFQIILCVLVWGAALLNMIIVLHMCYVLQCIWRWYSHVKACVCNRTVMFNKYLRLKSIVLIPKHDGEFLAPVCLCCSLLFSFWFYHLHKLPVTRWYTIGAWIFSSFYQSQ